MKAVFGRTPTSPRRLRDVILAPCQRLSWLFGVLAMPYLAAEAAGASFDFEVLQARAKALALQPPRARQGEVPAWLRQLSYDQLRQIQFDGRESLWRRENLPFQVQFLHPGFLFDKSVHIFEVQGSTTRALPFRRNYFNYGPVPSGDLPAGMGFAGIRLMYPLNGFEKPLSEVGSFLGASYFRFLAAGAGYGLSARGLALDTAEAGPEEFPVFTDFWLERPDPEARSLTILALLESESVTGAYRFLVTPGAATVTTVKAVIFRRRDSNVFGVAPLTSMFWRGENTGGSADDYRPEVHDSDGLLMQNGRGEWIWRPLENPRQIRVAAFADENPKAFGLLQRDRNFENYQDLEARYHARPSAWVEPVGAWGRGTIRLVELPTKDEFNDNSVVFWTPERLPPLGEAVVWEYRLHWFMDQIQPPAGFVRATRHGRAAYYEPGLERFVVDFDGPNLRTWGEADGLGPVLSVGAGAVLNHATLQKNPINGTWRVAFTLKSDGKGQAVELRCFLRRAQDVLTETWSYLWQP
ncbi:MAG: Glucans biosynthesis protein precursor [Verrucomicrobiota bacterium]